MIHICPDYTEGFFCTGEHCKMPCLAPADMTWTQCLGPYMEDGVSMACPEGAKGVLLRPEGLHFSQQKDASPGLPLSDLSRDQLALMLDARATMDIILQNRTLPMRSNVVLALTYGSEFDPMIATDARYAYEELDWGYTEQPYRQLSSVVQLQGSWELKRSDLLHILFDLHQLSQGDHLLSAQLQKTLDLFEPMSGAQYKAYREDFDRFLKPREYLFENLLVYLNHRYFMASAGEKTVGPGVKFTMVSFAALRAMAFRLYKETGHLTDNAFAALCRQYARCFEENQKNHQALLARFAQKDLYAWPRLQRMLWQ